MPPARRTTSSRSRPRRIAVVTGTRAEFGLLRPVMHVVDEHSRLELITIVTGVHLLPPARTVREVEREFTVHAVVKMQRGGDVGRAGDARALGRGVEGLARAFDELAPDIVLVLGDRIEAFAAASAAAVMGIHLAHMHGGDRAEGIADDSLRHAISRLAHLHLPATRESAERLVRMGEDPQAVHIVGSPAIDRIDAIPPLDDSRYSKLGSPRIVFLLHPLARGDREEQRLAETILSICAEHAPTAAMHPNHDPGRDGILRAIERSGMPAVEHLQRDEFIGLLKRAEVIVGNSSAGLIECAALGTWCINIGPRQSGRERAANVLDVDEDDLESLGLELRRFLNADRCDGPHPYGDGRCGERTAQVLARVTDLNVRKRIAY